MTAEIPAERQWEDCTAPCRECPHCTGCGGSQKRGGPYGCVCDVEPDELDDERYGYEYDYD